MEGEGGPVPVPMPVPVPAVAKDHAKEGAAGEAATRLPGPEESLATAGAFEHSIQTEEDVSKSAGTVEGGVVLM